MSTADAPGSFTPAGLVGTVSRAFKVLEIVAHAGDGIPAKAIARRAGLKLSTTYHLLHTLVYEGYLVRLQGSRGYGLGYKVADLNLALHRELVGSARVTTALSAAHERARAAMYFCVVRDDAHLVVAEVVDSPDAPRATPLAVGFHEAAHASAYGKVLLAHMPKPRRREYLSSFGLPKVTERTITAGDEFDDHLAEIMANETAFDLEEFQPGLACVSAPVRDPAGTVIGAVAASAPVQRFVRHRDTITRAVLDAAAAL